jgi:hypothetical protein
VDELTRTQRICLWTAATAIGLGLAAILHAGVLGGVGLVAAVGIAIGFGFAAAQRARQRSDRDSD